MDSYAYSCNSSFGNIGLKLPDNLLKDTCEALFFNEELPTEIPHTKSLFSLAADDTDWQTAATAIGQGHTQVTPLQMVMIAATIANGGNMMKPYMVDAVETAGRRTPGKKIHAGFLRTDTHNPGSRPACPAYGGGCQLWYGHIPVRLWIFGGRQNGNRRGQRQGR